MQFFSRTVWVSRQNETIGILIATSLPDELMGAPLLEQASGIVGGVVVKSVVSTTDEHLKDITEEEWNDATSLGVVVTLQKITADNLKHYRLLKDFWERGTAEADQNPDEQAATHFACSVQELIDDLMPTKIVLDAILNQRNATNGDAVWLVDSDDSDEEIDLDEESDN